MVYFPSISSERGDTELLMFEFRARGDERMLCLTRYSSLYLGMLGWYSGQSRLAVYGISTGGTFMMDRELIQPRSVPT